MDRGHARPPCLSRDAVLLASLCLCGCSTLHPNPPPMPQPAATAEPAEAAPLPEAVKPVPEPAPPQMASVERPPPAIPARPPAVPPRPKPSEPPPSPVPDMNTLIGADFAAILNVFRAPDTVQKNALYVVWVYSPPGCTLQLFFYPDIQTTQFHLLKYDLKSTVRETATAGPECMQGIVVSGQRGVAAQ